MTKSVNNHQLSAGILVFALLATCLDGWENPSRASTPQARRAPLSHEEYDSSLGQALVHQGERAWWTVWVDRQDVSVYKDRMGQEVRTDIQLRFLEELIVLDEEPASRMLLVGKTSTRPLIRTIEPVIDKVVGWVRWDNLLLRDTPIRSKDTGIYRRAFIINDWRRFTAGMDADEMARLMVHVRAEPSHDAASITTISGVDNRMLFVYKYDTSDNRPREWYLVGRSNLVITGRVEDHIIGWIPSARAQPWDTRQALEPHPERTSHAHIYSLSDEVNRPDAQPMYEDMLSREEWPPDKWRYPVLEFQPGREAIQIGWHGDLSVAGVGHVPGDEVARAAATAYELMKNVNIIFVMDATKSMGPFLQAVGRELSGVASDIAANPPHTLMKLRFGAVLYRDLLDLPRERIEVSELNPKVAVVGDFLRSAKEPTPGNDPDFEEALYKGVEEAVTKVAVPGQTSIIILVADAGNAHSRHDIGSTLRDGIRNTAPRIIAVHLQRPPINDVERRAINAFVPDVERIFQLVRAEQDRVYAQVADAANVPLTRVDPTNLLSVTGHDDAAFRAAGQSVRTVVRNLLDLNSKALDAFPGVLSGDPASVQAPGGRSSVGEVVAPYAPSAIVLEMLIRTIGEDQELFDQLVARKVQLFDKGYTALSDANGRPLMRPVQLVSRSELQRTVRALEELFSGAVPDRTSLIKAWKDVIAGFVDPIPQDANELFRSLGAVMLREDSPLLRLDPQQIAGLSNAEVDEIVTYAHEALQKLYALNTERPEIWFHNYNEEYAWITSEMMP